MKDDESAANDVGGKVERFPSVDRPNLTPLMALKEIENAVMAGEVEHIMIVVHKKVGDGDRLRWVASQSDWTIKAAMAGFLNYTVHRD